MSKKRHIIFLQDLSSHSVREVCLGAAEDAATRADWSFDPWPIADALGNSPSRGDLELADGLITAEKVSQRLFGRRPTNVPQVLFLTDIASRDVPSVSLDEVAIGRMAAGHLYSRGYRNLAFVGSSGWRWSRGRKQGFMEAMQCFGLNAGVYEFPLNKVPVFWSWDIVHRNESLSEVLDSLPKPCGVFGANDVIACFVVQTAREMGYRVPEDVAVVGCDDDPIPNAAAGLALSSIRPDFREVGRRTARVLANLLRGKPVPIRELVPPVCVTVRASTDAFTTEDDLVNRVQKFIEEHRHEPLLVSDVIRAIGTNRMTLGKRFRRYLDVGIQEYILKRRIEYACDQLREGRLSVEKIAQTCGFSSSSYFSRVFKKITHMSPGSVRRKR